MLSLMGLCTIRPWRVRGWAVSCAISIDEPVNAGRDLGEAEGLVCDELCNELCDLVSLAGLVWGSGGDCCDI